MDTSVLTTTTRTSSALKSSAYGSVDCAISAASVRRGSPTRLALSAATKAGHGPGQTRCNTTLSFGSTRHQEIRKARVGAHSPAQAVLPVWPHLPVHTGPMENLLKLFPQGYRGEPGPGQLTAPWRSHCSTLRYVTAKNRWYEWAGDRWARDETRRPFDFARKIAADTKGKGRARIERAAFAAGVEKFAQADQTMRFPSITSTKTRTSWACRTRRSTCRAGTDGAVGLRTLTTAYRCKLLCLPTARRGLTRRRPARLSDVAAVS